MFDKTHWLPFSIKYKYQDKDFIHERKTFIGTDIRFFDMFVKFPACPEHSEQQGILVVYVTFKGYLPLTAFRLTE